VAVTVEELTELLPRRRHKTAAPVREPAACFDGRTTWPGPAEFDVAGRRDLYAAASRAGGIGRWRAIVGR